MRKIPLLGILLLLLAGCERDDICPENPRLDAVIRFKGYVSGQPQEVDSLEVDYQGKIVVPATVTDSLALPLPPDTDSARLVFVRRHAGISNPDTLIFTYERQPEFVSKACGFRLTYRHLNVQPVPDNDTWIRQIDINRTEITDDTLAHITIYH